VSERAWPERCRERLVPELNRVRLALERGLAPKAEGAKKDAAAQASVPHAAAPASDLALDRLIEAFGLSAFETALLVLCAGVELDGRIAASCARAHAEPKRRCASFGLALALLPEPHFDALAPVAPLRRWGLVRLEPGHGISDGPLRIDERVLHYLLGQNYLDKALDGIVIACDGPAKLAASQLESARRGAASLGREAAGGRGPVLHVVGGSRAERVAIARQASRELGLNLYVLRGADLPSDARTREELAQLWAREAVLLDGALLVENDSSEAPTGRLAVASFLEAAGGVLCLSGGETPELRDRRIILIECRPPSAVEQRDLWREALGDAAPELGLDRLVAQFSLSRDAIEEVAAEARSGEHPQVSSQLWNAVRRRVRPSFGTLAQALEPKASWELLVLPAAQKAVLRDVAVHVRQRQTVYESWGFSERSSRGLGISALFAGPSGTGKTMAAEVLARELELDLVHIDLSRVISKYIGETERNLSQIFDAAEKGSAILLFDEADALFGRRSEVKDSHDRYANIEVSYLLQRMEAYRGLAVLTTNSETSLDTAFSRRLRFVVRFPHPEHVERSEIWRRVFPERTPIDRLDHERLGRLEVSGGNIRNIALHAAFLAAEERSAVGMRHCASAARSELRKLGLALPERELRAWE
jgi:hypothetical protein